jgi:hypothetical protein
MIGPDICESWKLVLIRPTTAGECTAPVLMRWCKLIGRCKCGFTVVAWQAPSEGGIRSQLRADVFRPLARLSPYGYTVHVHSFGRGFGLTVLTENCGGGGACQERGYDSAVEMGMRGDGHVGKRAGCKGQRRRDTRRTRNAKTESSSVHMDTERRVAGEAPRLTQGRGGRALAYRVDRLLNNGDRAGPGGTAFEEIIVARATEHSDPPRI